jgi:hypothetical protein
LILTVRWQTHGEKVSFCEHSLTRGLPMMHRRSPKWASRGKAEFTLKNPWK